MSLSQETVQKLVTSREGDELVKFLSSEVRALNQLSDIPDDWDDRQKAIEVTARKRAAQRLMAILKPFLDYQQPSEHTPELENPLYYDHSPKTINPTPNAKET